MNQWIRALLFAFLLELPLFILLVATTSKNGSSPMFTALTWYHIVQLYLLSFGWLDLFGHGQPSIGGLRFWHAGFALAAFLIQVALTSPLAFVLVRAIHHARKK